MEIEDAEKYIDPIGVIYSKDKKRLLVYPNNITIDSYKVLDSCEEIAANAFEIDVIETGSCYYDLEFKGNCLTRLILPNNLKKIGNLAFYGCLSLEEIEIPAAVCEIGCCPFVGCNKLRVLRAHPDNTVFDSRNNCNAIIETKSNTIIQGTNSTTIPISVKRIGNSAFAECKKIESIEIPDSVWSVGDSAFVDCISLRELELPSSINTIGENAIMHCASLDYIVINSKITGFNVNTLEDCEKLNSILVNSNVYNYYEEIFSFTPLIALLKVNLLSYTFYVNEDHLSYIKNGSIYSINELTKYNNSSLYFFCKANDNYYLVGDYSTSSKRLQLYYKSQFWGDREILMVNRRGELLATSVAYVRSINVVKNTMTWILLRFGNGYFLFNRNFQIVYSTVPHGATQDWTDYTEGDVVVIDGVKHNDLGQKCDLLSRDYWDSHNNVRFRCYIDFSNHQIISIEELPLYTIEKDDFSLGEGLNDQLGCIYSYNSTNLPCVSPCKIFNQEGQLIGHNLLIHSLAKNYNFAFHYLFPQNFEYTKIDCYASKDGFEAIAYSSNNERYYAYRYSLEHKSPDEIHMEYVIIKLAHDISLNLFTHTYANLTECFPYLIFKKNDKLGVLLKGKQILPILYDKIAFVNKEAVETNILHYDLWYYENDKVITYRNAENVFICADNYIFDLNGNTIHKWDYYYKLLDTYDNYIAYLYNGRSIRIYRIFPIGKYSRNENEKDYFFWMDKKYSGICESIPYLYVNIKGKNYLEISRSYCERDTNPFFDLESFKFTINPIINPMKMPERPNHHVYDDSYSLIEDGLDGFPEAIWNID